MAVILSSTFQPLKRFFDRITNHLFYQDAYDPQELIDRLNKALVSSVDIKMLAIKSSAVISESLKTEYVKIGVYDNDRILRLYSHDRTAGRIEQFQPIVTLAPRNRRKVLVADDLDQKNELLRDAMQAQGMAMLIRLTPNARSEAPIMNWS
jgi:hypothetical protein